MRQHQETLTISTGGTGLREITSEVEAVVRKSGLRTGMCHVYVQHTSASLLIQENADPSARRDLERWFHRLVPEEDPLYTHTAEGADDMPSHLSTFTGAKGYCRSMGKGTKGSCRHPPADK